MLIGRPFKTTFFYRSRLLGTLFELTHPVANSNGEELKRTISLLNAVIESTADGILVVDRIGKIVHFNHKFGQMWGIPESILESRDDSRAIEYVLKQLKHPEQFVNKINELYSQPDVISYDRLEFLDDRVFDRYSHPHRLGDEYVGRVWSFRDVTQDTESKRAVERRANSQIDQEKSAREDAERLVKMRDDFVSVAAHELRTPLTSLELQVEFLKNLLSVEEFSSCPKMGVILKVLENSKRQLGQFVKLLNDVLSLSQMDAGKLILERNEVRLDELIQNSLESLQGQLSASGCVLKIRSLMPVIGYWDPVRIEQAFVNLLTNAMKYGARNPIEIEVLVEKRLACLSVRDHGRGIAKEDQGRIFERFERTTLTKGVSGFGLGLYITRQIVEAHHGRIWVESDLGHGSTFHLELPLRG